MIKNIVAQRYAQALISAYDDAQLSGLESALKQVHSFLKTEKTIQTFLFSPIVAASEKKEVLLLLIHHFSLDATIKNFLFILVDKDRLTFLYNIISCAIKNIHRRQGIYDFTLITAHKIDDTTVEKIHDVVNKHIQGKIQFNHCIDPAIRGGFVAFNEDLAVDASVRSNLLRIKQQFKGL